VPKPSGTEINFHEDFALAVYRGKAHMAAKYLRRQTWWIRFYHPHSGELVRASLDTHDEARAELLRQRVELETTLLKAAEALRQPRFKAAEMPAPVGAALGSVAPPPPPQAGSQDEMPARPQAAPAKTRRRTPVNEALKAYMTHIRSENAPLHVENKVSMLRRFVGAERVEEVMGYKAPAGRAASAPFFRGRFLDEITPALLQEFMEGMAVGPKTKRHYREFFHHFFEFCLKFGIFTSSNWHCPNPVAALPSYLSRNRRIIFLTDDQVEEQIAVLTPHAEMAMAVAIMIFAGLRRAETLWLTRDAISPDLTFISVANRIDEEQDIESTLKTGERTVSILPQLRPLLARYLAQLKGDWLIPKPKGGRWRGDSFGKKLRRINDAAGMKWSCLHYRHSFATARAAEGWSLFQLAKQMGNSVAIIEEYYAAYIRPEQPSGAGTANGMETVTQTPCNVVELASDSRFLPQLAEPPVAPSLRCNRQ